MRLELGGAVHCQDGAALELADLVVDASRRRVTHLVVQPSEHHEQARLVPLDLASASDGRDGLTLDCSTEAFGLMEPVREYANLRPGERPDQGDQWSVGVEDVLVSELRAARPARGEHDGEHEPDLRPDPEGEVELRLTSSVYTADEHHVGTVSGVVVDEESRSSSSAPVAASGGTPRSRFPRPPSPRSRTTSSPWASRRAS